VLPVSWTTVRLFLHVLGATVWVGGQLTLAGLVPGLRRVSPDAPRAVARRFNVIAWVAFAVLIATGIWNILAIRPARSAVPLAVFGALSGLTALTAAVPRRPARGVTVARAAWPSCPSRA
jgi:putative copper export protein